MDNEERGLGIGGKVNFQSKQKQYRKIPLSNVVFILIVFFFSACTGPKVSEVKKEVAEDADATQTLCRLLDGVSLKEGDWPADRWWEEFQDRQLNALIETALKNNPSIDEAKHRLAQFESRVKKEKSFFFPHVGLNLQEDWHHYSRESIFRTFAPGIFPAVINQIDLSLNLSYEFDLWGKIRSKVQAALSRARAQRVAIAEVQLLLISKVLHTYISLGAVKEKISLTKQIIQDYQALEELYLLQKVSGISPIDPAWTTKDKILEQKKHFDTLKKAEFSLELQLKELLGYSPDFALDLGRSSIKEDPILALPAVLSIDLLARRPDLMRMIWLLEASSKDVAVAKTAFLPSLNLMALLGLESLGWNSLLRAHSYQGALTPALHLPIFEAGKLKANLSENEEAFQTLVYQYKDSILKAVREVVDNINQFKKLAEIGAYQADILFTKQDFLRLESMRYTQKLSSRLAVIRRSIELHEAKIVDVSLKQAKQQMRVAIMQSLGGGYNGRSQ